MLIYTPHITPRVEYIIQYFNEKLFITAELTSNKEDYIRYQGIKINYSNHRISREEFLICPAGLLHQQVIRKQQIECFNRNGTKAFFKTKNDDQGFDIFSAVFYLITRYEEYLEFEPDEYGRYAHWNALAWKEGFIHQPLIDIWLLEFSNELSKRFPNFKPQSKNHQLVLTYDIDIAWSYLHKGFWRNTGALLRNPASLKKRFKVLRGREADPFDSYQWLQQLHQQYQVQVIYFLLVATERSALDKNISPKKPTFHQLVKQLQQHGSIGLHASVFSNTAKPYLLKEKSMLEWITQSKIIQSRHHYLRLHTPHDYRDLIAAGITDDYTMGYGTVNGFRASTSNSFLWYDLESETTTSLRIHPFVFMDANSFYELRQSSTEAFAELQQLYATVKKVNGTFITVFHNHFLGTDEMFTGWREGYAAFVAATVGVAVVSD